MADADERPPRRRSWPAAVVCVALALAFALNAWLAASTKSATFDEPVYALSAWLSVNRGDFRLNPEHPALWKYLPAAALVGYPLKVDLAGAAGRAMFKVVESEWPFTVDTLYRTPGNDGIALVARARLAMTIVPLLLALVVARWAWAVAGPTAAIVATALLSLDPNLLAHADLVTNDVFATLIFAVAGLLTWRLGEQFTWRRAAALALTCGVGVQVKASCILLAATVGVPLLWWALGRSADGPATTRMRRLSIVAATGVAAVAMAYLLLWPAYQFRLAPTPAGERFEADSIRRFAAFQEIVGASIAHGGMPVGAEAAKALASSHRLSLPARAIAFLEDRGVVPQAYATGLMYVRAKAIARPSYLLGEDRLVGSYAYFPLAIAFKTPLVVLAASALALVTVVPNVVRRPGAAARWTLLCLLAPPLIYVAAAITANLNIGIRHVLPVLPPLYVALGACAGRAIASRPRVARPLVVGAVTLLAVEVLTTAPNYLAFFNLAAGGARGGLAKLGDSNLDWGQDLPALSDYYRLWRRANPVVPFYLSYFGSADPRAYGIDYVNATPGYPFARDAPTDDFLRTGGLLAISATALQGLVDERSRPLMARLRGERPLDVLNGSIYIYRLAPADAGATPSPAPDGLR